MKRIKALVYLIVLCFLGLCFTAYLLYRNMGEVRKLNTHKEVLIDRLSEEVYETRMLKRENDSLRNALDDVKIGGVGDSLSY